MVPLVVALSGLTAARPTKPSGGNGLLSLVAAAVPSAGLVVIFLVLESVNLRGPEVDAIVGAMEAGTVNTSFKYIAMGSSIFSPMAAWRLGT